MLSRLPSRRPFASDDDYLAFCIVENPDAPPSWIRCGQGRLNADGSLNIRLDALPLSGELHLRPVVREAPVALAPSGDARREPSPHPLHS